MNSISAILVATDFSAAANNAVRRAALLASDHDARLCVLHVVPYSGVYRAGNRFVPPIDPSPMATQARADLLRLADELSLAFNVTPEITVKVGDPFDLLVSDSSRANLVVLGQRAGGSISSLLLGTRAGRLLDVCACPVLVVKQAVEGPYRRVLTGFDLTPNSDGAALVAARLVPTATLHFTHVVRSKRGDAMRKREMPASVLTQVRAREEAGVVARMQRRAAAIGFDSRALRFAVGRGSGASTILSHEQAQGVDVIAVGRQRRARWLDALLGSVSRGVLARSRGDVLVVPCPRNSPLGSGANDTPSRAVFAQQKRSWT